MKQTRKLTTSFIMAIIMVSLVSSIVFVKGDANDEFISHTAHSLDEDSWSIIYDFAGDQLVKDFTVGPNNASLNAGATDSDPDTDLNFYGAYANMGQVQTLYIANKNITTTGGTGSAPYQMLIQHYRTPGNYEAFVINTFMGLVAYQDIDGDNVPSSNDSMYMGWSAHSELFKQKFNELLIDNSVPIYNRFNPAIKTEGNPIEMTKEEDNGDLTYRYGISYTNIFVVWQEINVTTTTLNDTTQITKATILNNVVAVCMLDSLNFTYVLEGEESDSGYTNCTTHTEYQIGNVSTLWIRDDSPTTADLFGGYSYTYDTGKNMALYNETDAIQKRLKGNETATGFGLAIANYVDLVLLGTRPPAQALRDRNSNIINPENDELNITRMDIMLNVRNRLTAAYRLDFQGTEENPKDKYILGGDEENPKNATTRLIRNGRLNSPIGQSIHHIAREFVVGVFTALYPGFADSEYRVFHPSTMLYLSCYPEWNGQTIIHDPTFIAFGGAGTNLGTSIPGSSITLISLVSIGAIIAVISVKKKNIR